MIRKSSVVFLFLVLVTNVFSISNLIIKVVDINNTPIVGAVVEISDKVLKTDVNGEIFLRNLNEGKYLVVVKAFGFEQVLRELKLKEGDNIFTVVLRSKVKTISLYLNVVEKILSEAVAGAVVKVSGDEFEREAITDREGSVYFYDLPAGKITIYVKKPGFKTYLKHFNFLNDAQLLVKLERIAKLYPITFIVVNSVTNKPVVGAFVEIGSNIKTTNAIGKTIFNLPAGSYMFKVYAPSYEKKVDVIKITDKKKRFLIKLQPKNYILDKEKREEHYRNKIYCLLTGRILGEDGEAVTAALIKYGDHTVISDEEGFWKLKVKRGMVTLTIETIKGTYDFKLFVDKDKFCNIVLPIKR